ncbi:MAG: hypothetical protein ACKO0Z_25130 [Betaproteobacteria bacterium]
MAIKKKVLIDLPSDQIDFGTLGDATDVAPYDLNDAELAYYNEVINDPDYAVSASYYGLTADELFKVQLEESRALEAQQAKDADAFDLGV